MTTLVTGGAGFIGSHLVARLLDRGDSVVVVDSFDGYYSPAWKWRNVAEWRDHPRVQIHEVDIRDRSGLAQIFATAPIRRVAHLAALAGVRASVADPPRYEAVNVQGTHTLLDLAARAGVESFVFASSSSVYGVRSRVPFDEADPVTAPASPYAATKRAAELLCERYHRLHGLSCTCLRYFTVYGPRGRPDMAPYRFVEAILEGRELVMFGDGSSERDYTYVTDIVDGTVAAIDARLPFEVINLGSARPVALRDFITLIERLTGRRARVRSAPPQPGDVPKTGASVAKAWRLLGYSPKVALADGLAQLVDWYEAERPWRLLTPARPVAYDSLKRFQDAVLGFS